MDTGWRLVITRSVTSRCLYVQYLSNGAFGSELAH